MIKQEMQKVPDRNPDSHCWQWWSWWRKRMIAAELIIWMRTISDPSECISERLSRTLCLVKRYSKKTKLKSMPFPHPTQNNNNNNNSDLNSVKLWRCQSWLNQTATKWKIHHSMLSGSGSIHECECTVCAVSDCVFVFSWLSVLMAASHREQVSL